MQLSVKSQILGISDANGFIKIDTISNEIDTVIFYHEQYHPKRVNIRLLDGSAVILNKKTSTLPQIIILPRIPKVQGDLALKSDLVSKKDIALLQPQNAADLLGLNQQVYIQKSQQGGGSPMIRGFATSRILLVVDGVRMNTAIFRAGNVQNVLSLDPMAIESSEVLFGPASQLYGSDAIGGVLIFSTKEAPFSDSLQQGGMVNLRYGSASKEGSWHAEYGVSMQKFSSLSSVSFSNFGDLRMGSNGPEAYERPDYVIYRQGKGDTIVENSDPNVQAVSAYRQFNVMQKFRFKLNKKTELKYGLHYSTSSNTPRYDRLIVRENDTLVNGDWYYGPQQWFMNNLSITNTSKTTLSDRVQFTLARQNFTESRNDRKYQSTSLRQREEKVAATSLNIDAQKKLTKRRVLNYGAEYIFNALQSTAQKLNIEDGSSVPTSTRYPNGSTWASAGAYINIQKRWEKQLTEAGVRYNHVSTSGTFDTTYINLPVPSYSNQNDAVTGSLSHLFYLKNGKLGLLASTAFKSPNIDDITKVFDSNVGYITVPNTQLKPEYAYNAEVNLTHKIGKRIELISSVFYTYLTDVLTTTESTFNGQDSLLYDGVTSKVQQLTNQDYATVYGAQVSLSYKISSDLSLESSYTFLNSSSSSGEPIRHITPNFGGTHLSYQMKKGSILIYSRYNQEFKSSQFTINELQDDFLYAKDGDGLPYSPGWVTFNARAVYPITETIQLNFGIENILDKRYRPYGSGISAAGRNVLFSIQAQL